MEVKNSINKKVVVNGIERIVSFGYSNFESEGKIIKESMKRTKWGTFKERQILYKCIFHIDNMNFEGERIFIHRAGGGYAEKYIFNGKTFGSSQKKVIEFLMENNNK